MSGEGPYCPYCCNASKEWQADPDGFDIHTHVQNCPARNAKSPDSNVKADRGFV